MQELEKMKAKAEKDLAKVEYLYVLYRYIFFCHVLFHAKQCRGYDFLSYIFELPGYFTVLVFMYILYF